MKRVRRYVLLLCVLSTELFAAHSSIYLKNAEESSGYTRMQIYFYTHGDTLSENEADPERYKYICELGVDEIGPKNPSGSPQWVRLLDERMNENTIKIREGETEGVSSQRRNGNRIKVELLDEDEEKTSGEPTFFHLTDFEGNQYRVHAKAGENHRLSHPVFKMTPDGKIHDFKGSGFQVVLNDQGHLIQALDTQKGYMISYPDARSRTVSVYLLSQLELNPMQNRFEVKKYVRPEKEYNLRQQNEKDGVREMTLTEREKGETVKRYTWAGRSDPFLYHFTNTREGEPLPAYEKKYWVDDGDGRLHHIIKKYENGGVYQYEVDRMYIKRQGWLEVYKRESRNGSETANRYEYIEDSLTGTLRKTHIYQKKKEGNWFRKTFDDVGRISMEWTPVREVVEEPIPKDSDVMALMDLFPDESAESIKKHQKVRWVPESPFENLEKAKEAGQVVYYEYEPHFAEDEVADEDDRPRTVARWRQGEFEKREWFAYGSRDDGSRYALEERSMDSEAVFGAEQNQRETREFLPDSHPVAPGKLQSIAHKDGSLEYFYYSKGNFDRKTNVFTEKEDGLDFRMISTRGKLIDGNWMEGTRSTTRIRDENDEILWKSVQRLRSDGSWQEVNP